MSKLFLILLLVFVSIQASASIREPFTRPNDVAENVSHDDIANKKRIISNIVDSYRPAIVLRYGYDVKLSFFPAEAFQMLGGHKSSGQLVIEVYAKALTNFNNLSIVTAICHELGHILGDVSNKLAGNLKYHPLDSVEGEADYFSGSCARKYFSNNLIEDDISSFYCRSTDHGCGQAVAGARHALLTLYNKEIDERDAELEIYSNHHGINPSYPNPSCRLFSMISGIMNRPRPKCWYNPL